MERREQRRQRRAPRRDERELFALLRSQRALCKVLTSCIVYTTGALHRCPSVDGRSESFSLCSRSTVENQRALRVALTSCPAYDHGAVHPEPWYIELFALLCRKGAPSRTNAPSVQNYGTVYRTVDPLSTEIAACGYDTERHGSANLNFLSFLVVHTTSWMQPTIEARVQGSGSCAGIRCK